MEKKILTVSDLEIKNIYTPRHIQNLDYPQDLGYPGFYPRPRGVQLSMYRGRLWTMRMFAGLGSARTRTAVSLPGGAGSDRVKRGL